MKGKKHLAVGFCSLLFATTSLWAQNPTEYVKWDDGSTKFFNAYQAWQAGNPLYSGDAANDEQFFISRVRFRERFRNQQTQVDKTRTQENDKNVLNWVPIGTTNNGNPNALPSGIFDSDVFSMWSYLTHFGNWTAPLVRIPAAFVDAAHKNGVSTSALSSIPWAATISPTDGGHGQNLAALYNGGAEKFIKFLKYYGYDGWGMNSEFNSSGNLHTNLMQFMQEVYQKAVTEKQLPSYAAIWYTLITNAGTLSAVDGLTDDNKNWFNRDGKGVSNYVFGNYNWNDAQLAKNDQLATSMNRDPRDVYAGMNQQGGEGRRWTTLAKYKTSIGLWGAHNMNMFYESRNELGSAPETQQETYQTRIERFFSNGNQNPAKPLEIKDGLTFSATALKSFHGISALSTAKSSLQWDLSQMPFYTFFNLGNGQYFNINGKTAFNGEWYNLGIQDYLPTWRYWFSTSFLGNDVPESGLSARFTWSDAWFGGSCLEVSGTSANEYLHLFKTKFALQQGDIITIRYKVTSGSATIKLVGTAENNESSPETPVNIVKSEDVNLDEWIEKNIEVGTSGRTRLKLAGKTLAALALQFENANNLKVLLGEISIKRGEVATPAVPTVTLAKVLKRSYKGIDGKIVFSMPRPATLGADDHIYNDDVKTSFYKLYVKTAGGQAKFVTATTSWAGLYFSAPYDGTGAEKVQFGVSAVGLDGKTESAIAWSEELPVVNNTIYEDIVINKPVIKPNEQFTVKYQDANHADATWTLVDKNGTEVYKSENTKSFTTSLAAVGLYTLKVTVGGETKTLGGFVQISEASKGAVPQIESLTFNGQAITDAASSVTTEANKQNALTYTGKSVNGAASRGIALQEKAVGVPASEVKVTDQRSASWTYSVWVKFNAINGVTQLLSVRNLEHLWPTNNWGAIWTTYNPSSKIIEIVRRRSWTYSSNPEHKQRYKIDFAPGAWYHLTFVFEKMATTNIAGRLYINGEPAEATDWENGQNKTKGDGLDLIGMKITQNRSDVSYYFGGSAFGRAGIDGVIDNVKFYNKALTDAEVKTEMYSLDANADGLKGFWNFEEDGIDGAKFASLTSSNVANLVWGESVAGVGEGVSIFTPAKFPVYEAGSPFINESKFVVNTTAEWIFPRGIIADATGTDTQGSAKVTYKKDGVLSGKLILKNSWGKDEREVKMITIGNPTAVEEVTQEVALTAFPNPFVEQVNVRFSTAGDYQLAIYDLAGNLVNRQQVSAQDGSVYSIVVNAPKGIYILRVQTTAGKLLQALKIQKN